jgi:hypothetical protein
MKRNENSNQTNIVAKPRWMRFGVIMGLVIMLGSINYGCEKEESDEYYVRYFIDSSNINTGGELYIIFTTEQSKDMILVFDQNTKWEATIGPVSKGFNAIIRTGNKTGTNDLHVYSEIDVSKNNSPFAFKKSDGPQSNNITVLSTSLEYTIDY